jgi:hypothetical protein
MVLILETACSIGVKSDESGGRKSSSQWRAARAWRMLAALWALRLSSTTICPSRSVCPSAAAVWKGAIAGFSQYQDHKVEHAAVIVHDENMRTHAQTHRKDSPVSLGASTYGMAGWARSLEASAGQAGPRWQDRAAVGTQVGQRSGRPACQCSSHPNARPC